MLRNAGIVLLSLVGIALTVHTVYTQSRPAFPEPEQPISLPVQSPFSRSVSGSGIVEAATENIAVASAISGIVAEVYAQPGDRVAAGAPLFRIDNREFLADRAVREAALLEAEAELSRLRALPRAEDIPIAQARLRAAEAEAANRASESLRGVKLLQTAVLSVEQVENRSYAAARTKAVADEARAALDHLLAGAWMPELAAAEARVASAKAELAAIDVDLGRLVVAAPINGQVLSSKARVGQHAEASSEGIMVLGETQTLRLRVDVDELDAWRVRPGAKAQAFLRGNPAITAEVDFFRIEPAVIPKISLTGSNSERTDTRVLQVLFTVAHAEFPAYTGQLVDVRIEESPEDIAAGARP